jgi:hypothetical protein
MVSEIQNMDKPSGKDLEKLNLFSRGVFYSDRRARQLNKQQQGDLQALATVKFKEWEAGYISEKKAALDALGNTVDDLEKVDDIAGRSSFLGQSVPVPLSQEGNQQVRALADAKRKAIAEESARPIVQKIATLPDEITSVPALDDLAKQLPGKGGTIADMQRGQLYEPIRKDIATKRSAIVTAHRQKLCDEALDNLDADAETAMLQVFPGISLRDYVCEAAKGGVQVSYVESGIWPLAKTAQLEVSLADEKTKVGDDVLKPGQTVSIDLSRIEGDRRMFDGPALIGTKRHDGRAEHNLTLENWVEFVGNTMEARPWYGNGHKSLFE